MFYLIVVNSTRARVQSPVSVIFIFEISNQGWPISMARENICVRPTRWEWLQYNFGRRRVARVVRDISTERCATAQVLGLGPNYPLPVHGSIPTSQLLTPGVTTISGSPLPNYNTPPHIVLAKTMAQLLIFPPYPCTLTCRSIPTSQPCKLHSPTNPDGVHQES
jgi:hypothetical protein